MASAGPEEPNRPTTPQAGTHQRSRATSVGSGEIPRVAETHALQLWILDFGTLRTEVSRGGSVCVSHFLPLRFRAQLAGLRIEFAEPYGACFALSCELALEAGLGFGLNAPAGHIILIKGDAGHFFL